MNHLVISIGIDIDVVKNVFGCKDEVLYNQVLASDVFKAFDEHFSSVQYIENGLLKLS